MGLDAIIVFAAADLDESDLSIPPRWEVRDRPLRCDNPKYTDPLMDLPEANWEIDCDGSRYYNESSPDHYRRYWPKLCAVLISLLGCPTVTKVWYGSDMVGPIELTKHRLLEICRHYLIPREKPCQS